MGLLRSDLTTALRQRLWLPSWGDEILLLFIETGDHPAPRSSFVITWRGLKQGRFTNI